MEVTNRFKGLELVNSVPEDLCMEVGNMVQETANKTIPKKKESKEATWSIWLETLTITSLILFLN